MHTQQLIQKIYQICKGAEFLQFLDFALIENLYHGFSTNNLNLRDLSEDLKFVKTKQVLKSQYTASILFQCLRFITNLKQSVLEPAQKKNPGVDGRFWKLINYDDRLWFCAKYLQNLLLKICFSTKKIRFIKFQTFLIKKIIFGGM